MIIGHEQPIEPSNLGVVYIVQVGEIRGEYEIFGVFYRYTDASEACEFWVAKYHPGEGYMWDQNILKTGYYEASINEYIIGELQDG